MRNPERTRLAVLGSPIAHSLSPTIHAAAYRVLDTGWDYGAHDVTGESLASFVAALDDQWRGLSLTMPLKRDVLPLLTARDEMVDRVGAANTVLLGDSLVSGFNTDVRGAVESFRRAGVATLDSVHILGAGATAASLLIAAVELGATHALISARTVERAEPLVVLGAREGIDVDVRPWGISDRSHAVPDAVISTIPQGAADLVFPEDVRSRSTLFDVAYDPWPTPLARAWSDVGGRVISGLDLLINQAVGQIRVFLTGDVERPLPDEESVIAAMWESVASRH
ncbi:shikimate dehydrogenase [Microbacteriaceae bacterium SG_E_30_P1]|uniref:Shikimate dehydrogenase n=1 Tax=Antiquaquibacter oligotrophicus TaxID=2880260 RepID=A0ABT6KLU6_9MICO|nr:shikimate dehydrogenase [Antiquaquibacter oligotrophicus]MDH6180990.1 shikimate dehydrogenase [Antiquaquibacter oligotrophicus]UDF13310.1 shikimate dehydrogenase [Antiquaquibacter oligotrophicus]